jgi:indole-3-glycerol phosphate synthase
MNILDTIIAHKAKEVRIRKSITPESQLMQSEYFKRTCLSLKAALVKPNATGIIAEFKRKSPSKGFINQYADVVKVTEAYSRFGASGMSVLTDHDFFGGSTKDLLAARHNEVPVLRKEFIIDAYQVTEAKAMGADVILLIAACLTTTEVEELSAYAKELKMEVLLELHDESELEHICTTVEMVGINNRNLKTFEVDINHSLKLAEQIPADKIKIAESGISSVETIQLFKDAGFKGFLMGENFMKEADPGEAFRIFIEKLRDV